MFFHPLNIELFIYYQFHLIIFLYIALTTRNKNTLLIKVYKKKTNKDCEKKVIDI